MTQGEILYNQGSISITLVLFCLIILCNEIGFRCGRFIQHRTDTELKSLTGSIQASILGLLALLLGFTFSMSMQRYDNRNHALIDEVNSLGTAMLRVKLLPSAYRRQTMALLHDYIDLRIAVSTVDLARPVDRKNYNKQSGDVQDKLWSVAIAASRDDPNPVTTGLFINALNAVFDAQGKRNALLQMHVPEAVLILLFIVFISSGAILGYSAGLSGNRVLIPSMLISLLISLIVFIIIDLDRPKRGLIRVNQQILHDLQQGDDGHVSITRNTAGQG